MGPALLIALESVVVPLWFPPACAQPTAPGYAMTEVHDSPRENSATHPAVLWIDNDGTIWMRDDDLAKWAVQPLPAEGRQLDNTQWHALNAVGLPYRFDTCTQSLWIAPPRDAQSLKFRSLETSTLRPAQLGGFLNLDLIASNIEHSGTQTAALADLGVSSGFNSLRGAWVADELGTRRLDSFFTWDDPASLRRLRLGDSITRTNLRGTSVRYGGVRWGTEFALEPEVPRFPLPSLTGEAALPSTVELYVDGVSQGSRPVDPGPFTISNAPTYSGNGDLQVVVRDALGRQTIYSQPFYVTAQALNTGTVDYAVEAGWQRFNFAQPGDRYRDPFGIGSYRYGFSDRFTAGGRLEVQEHARTAGGELLYAWPRFGQVTAGLAGSDADGTGSGGQVSLGFERLSRSVSFAVRGTASDPNYVELGRKPGEIAQSFNSQLGFALPNRANLSLAYAEERRRDREDIHLTALTYSQQIFGDWYSTASLLHSPEAGDSLALGLVRPFGNGNTFSLRLLHDGNGGFGAQFTLQHSPRGPLGWSGLASHQVGDPQASLANVGYSGARGSAVLSTAIRDEVTGTQAELNSGLAWLGRDIFWTRPVRDSFAVADTNAPDVRIYRDNQLVGTTGKNGRALVPDLSAYVPARISLEPLDLPLDQEVTRPSQEIKLAPGGARITLAGPARNHVQLRLRLPSGTAVPMGSMLLVDGVPADLPVGTDGLVYLETTAKTVTLGAQWNGSNCQTGLIAIQAIIRDIVCSPQP